VVSVAANRITSPPASRVTVTNPQTGSVTSFPAAVTVARAGTTQVTRVISTGTPVGSIQPGSALMSGKTGGSPVVCSQGAPKVASGTPTLVVSTTTVSGTKLVLSPQVSIAGKTKTMLTGSVERRMEPQTSCTTVPSSSTSSSAQRTRELVTTPHAASVSQVPVVAQPEVKGMAAVKPEPGGSSSAKEASSS